MGEVIGFKGTPQQRLESWETLLLLRRLVKAKMAAEQETNWYYEDLAAYAA